MLGTIYGHRFDDAIQTMSEFQVSSELDGHPLSPEMNRRFNEEESRLGNIMPMEKVREQVEAQRLAEPAPCVF